MFRITWEGEDALMMMVISIIKQEVLVTDDE